ncbi:MAG: PilZ domain-containing protein, partial [Planctomycetes bacterium]|nr:PilZ domain-containing protein [Planctomycetota bacterium]
MITPDPKGTHTSDRRRAPRRETKSPVSVQLTTTQLDGISDNLSKTGILFFTDGDLRVTVSVQGEDGETKQYTGQLVRCERIQGGRRGWAVEFEDP